MILEMSPETVCLVVLDQNCADFHALCSGIFAESGLELPCHGALLVNVNLSINDAFPVFHPGTEVVEVDKCVNVSQLGTF